jgi:hypothetical protein
VARKKLKKSQLNILFQCQGDLRFVEDAAKTRRQKRTSWARGVLLATAELVLGRPRLEVPRE